jgi:DNA adenine methylase
VVNFYRVLRDRPDELARSCELTPYSRVEFRDAYENLDAPANELELATVWPCAQAMPTASTLNHPGGASAVANATIVTGGRACVYLSSAAQVIVDRLSSL